MLREICQAGELVLRQSSRPLTSEEILSGPIQELIASMFETMRAAPGVGLGLAICQAIVRAHGGEIEAHRRAGAGARFEFTLPSTEPEP